MQALVCSLYFILLKGAGSSGYTLLELLDTNYIGVSNE